jgi:transcriptional regulator with XRE-family HTH domain
MDHFKTARLTTVEIAKLLRVSRVTVSMWRNGRAKPHRLLQDRYDSLAEAVATATREGRLPLPVGTPHRERWMMLLKALAPFVPPTK